MGGTPPIGYRPDGRSLAIVVEHAMIVRHIFKRYCELANVRLLADELEEQDIRSPDRQTAAGKAYGGRLFSRGQLYKMLSSVLYIGRIEHGPKTYAGNHEPIIEQPVWDLVQSTLAANVNGKRVAARTVDQSVLAGRLFDDRGIPMVAAHACKGKVRYRYYVSRDLQHGGDADAHTGWRIPARQIEPLVFAKVAEALRDPLGLLVSSDTSMPAPDQLSLLVTQGKALADKLSGPREQASRALRKLVAEVRIHEDQVEIVLDQVELAKMLAVPALNGSPKLVIPARLKRSGLAMKLVLPGGSAAVSKIDRTLVKAIVRGRAWWSELQSDPSLTLAAIGTREGLTSGYVVRILRLAYLSPEVLNAVLHGKAAAHLSITSLTMADGISPRWDEQRRLLGAPFQS